MWLFLQNTWVWIGGACSLAAFLLKHYTNWEWLQHYIGTLDLVFLVGLGAILAAMVWAIVVQANTKYQFFPEARIMVKQTGVWNKNSDSIMVNMVFDCDILQNPLEQTTNSATMVVRTADGRTTFFPFTLSPQRFREVVLVNKDGKFMFSV
jgi:uncharacterized membrane protein YdbT with pleckstrin-like domain